MNAHDKRLAKLDATVERVRKRHPMPWKVEANEPYEMILVDANGTPIDGISLWLDDACKDDNPVRIENAEAIAHAWNKLDAYMALHAAGTKMLDDAKRFVCEYLGYKDIKNFSDADEVSYMSLVVDLCQRLKNRRENT